MDNKIDLSIYNEIFAANKSEFRYKEVDGKVTVQTTSGILIKREVSIEQLAAYQQAKLMQEFPQSVASPKKQQHRGFNSKYEYSGPNPSSSNGDFVTGIAIGSMLF